MANQNESAAELAKNVENALRQSQSRFAVHDTATDTTYRFPNAQGAINKAGEIGAESIEHMQANNRKLQVTQNEGEWKRSDGKSLNEIQKDIDKTSSDAIRMRADLLLKGAQDVDAETLKGMALADVTAFRRLQDAIAKEDAAKEIAANARLRPEYKAALDSSRATSPGVADTVYAMASSAQEKQDQKSDPAQLGSQAEALKEQPAQATIDAATLARLAASRANDSAAARQSLGLNAIEPSFEKQAQPLTPSEDAKRDAWVKKAAPVETPKPAAAAPVADNKVESDEIFTARTADVKPVVPPDVEKQYLRVGDKFYNSKNTDLVAFEDKGNKLETRSNSEQIAASMVRIAEARGWDEIKVTGTESFRRDAWLEAASRGMRVKGYEASEQDKAELLKRTNQTQANKIEPENRPAEPVKAEAAKEGKEAEFRARETASSPAPVAVAVAVAKPDAEAAATTPTAKPDSPARRMAEVFATEPAEAAVKKHPELAGAVAAAAIIDKKAEADGFTPEQREVMAKRVRLNIANAIERGDLPKVTIREEVQERSATKEKERERER